MSISPDNPILVQAWRGGIVESAHRGAFAVVDADGALRMAIGDIDRPIFPRSACKVLQALPLVASGAADALQLTDEELAAFAVQRPHFPGLEIRARLGRSYPYGMAAAHVLGYVGGISADDKKVLDPVEYAGTTHVGKVPIHLSAAPMRSATAVSTPQAQNLPPRKNNDEIRKTVTHLRNQLQKAVADERFEDAARLKNEIRDLEKQLTEA